jgi:dipeptidyl aminopeptidase/acylaminoacyl peptidase
MKVRLLLFVAVLSWLSPLFLDFADAQQTTSQLRPVTIDDHFQIREVSDPQITDDGQWIAYTVASALLKDDKNLSRIWMVAAHGGEAIPLTSEEVSSSSPRWSPDGKYLAFLSDRKDDNTDVWLLDRRGGEAQRLTETVQGVDSYAWSPDSKRLVLVMQDPSPEELEDAAAKKCEDTGKECKNKKTAKKGRPWVIDRYVFKEDEIGYLDRRRKHLYVFDLATKSLTQITSGDFDDAHPAWSPDGKSIAFDSNRSTPDPDRNTDSNIWVVAAENKDKGAHLTQVTNNPGEDNTPAWSPDGKSIAYITQLDPKFYIYATNHLALSPAGGGEAKVLTKTFDRMASAPHFSPDGRSLYFIADDDGTQILCKVPVQGGEIARSINGRFIVYEYSIAETGDIAAELAVPERPGEIYTIPGGKLTRVTHTNDGLMSQLKVSMPEYVKFKSKDGTQISGYLYKPTDYVAGKKYPTLLHPHGGPVWAYYAEYAHSIQFFVAQGYVVLCPNPRGSTGYGEQFAKAINADWGNKDFQDDMAMVDYAIGQGISDPDKLGVFGWSYGGISTDFIIAQTKRFKAAISGAGASLYASMYGHDRYTRDYDSELGHPWEKENRATWDKVSMFFKVEDITTPVMFMGGDIDWNVPILGGEQMYQALKTLGRETELVVYPGEYHEFKAPSHIKDRLERYQAWFAHYVKADGSPARPAASDTKQPGN